VHFAHSKNQLFKIIGNKNYRFSLTFADCTDIFIA
jgi:hypothetical protein